VTNKLKYILIAGEKQRIGIPASPNTKFKTKVKIGHGGTLDPMAEGVLVIGVGSGTKLLQSYLSGGKEYVATARLGEERVENMGVFCYIYL
jgi:tRNA U55 pseudouridine synthase TruB